MRRWTNRRLSTALAGTAILALLVPATVVAAEPATTPTDDPTEAAAGWLATQLVEGERMETTFDGETFPDYGLTADVVVALAGAEVAAGHIEAAIDWLEGNAESYTAPGDDVYAGPTAKLILVLLSDGRDTIVDDRDLVAQLEDREQDNGRYSDESAFGDFSNTISQSLAVLALEQAEGTSPSPEAVSYLADQACADGGFPQELQDGDVPDNTQEATDVEGSVEDDECTSQVDATGFAVEALAAVGETGAVDDASQWLTDVQQEDGGFVGTEGTANANSTGLAALALHVAGLPDEATAAREFILGLQDDCDGAEPGSIRYDDADTEQVDRSRATAQALPGLTGVGFEAAQTGRVRDDVPTLDCAGTPEEPGPGVEFSDLSSDNVHYDAIIELARREVLEGHLDGTYRPADGLTRGQLASVLARAGDIEPVGGERFDDTAGSPHEGAINALTDAGIVEGYADGTYRPSRAVRRDQAAALIGRWQELEGVEDDWFDDLDDTIHRPMINALASLDVARGDGEGRFHPHRDVRRDQTASLVLRALRVLDEDGEA